MAAEPAASTDDWSTASSIFTRLRPEVFVALFTRSLLATYCSPTGAAVLDPMAVSDDVELDPRATSMAGDSFRRLFRTVQFLDTMLTTPDPPSTAAVDGSPGRAKTELLRHIREGHDAAKADRAALAADDAVGDRAWLHLPGWRQVPGGPGFQWWPGSPAGSPAPGSSCLT